VGKTYMHPKRGVSRVQVLVVVDVEVTRIFMGAGSVSDLECGVASPEIIEVATTSRFDAF